MLFIIGVTIHCPGTAGHGSLLLENTSGEKLRVVIDHFMDFRESEARKYKGILHLGDITTVNLTRLKVFWTYWSPFMPLLESFSYLYIDLYIDIEIWNNKTQ